MAKKADLIRRWDIKMLRGFKIPFTNPTQEQARTPHGYNPLVLGLTGRNRIQWSFLVCLWKCINLP